jgi:hypothetical protein
MNCPIQSIMRCKTPHLRPTVSAPSTAGSPRKVASNKRLAIRLLKGARIIEKPGKLGRHYRQLKSGSRTTLAIGRRPSRRR